MPSKYIFCKPPTKFCTKNMGRFAGTNTTRQGDNDVLTQFLNQFQTPNAWLLPNSQPWLLPNGEPWLLP